MLCPKRFYFISIYLDLSQNVFCSVPMYDLFHPRSLLRDPQKCEYLSKNVMLIISGATPHRQHGVHVRSRRRCVYGVRKTQREKSSSSLQEIQAIKNGIKWRLLVCVWLCLSVMWSRHLTDKE